VRTRPVEISSPLFKSEQPNTLRVLYFVGVSYIPPKWRCPLCGSSNVRCVPRQRDDDEHDREWTLYQCKSAITCGTVASPRSGRMQAQQRDRAS
jgi:hypothetical protein